MADFTSGWSSGHAESYKNFPGSAILSGQQEHVPFIDCQARFLALAGRLNIPVMSRRIGRGVLTTGSASIGKGLSFSVSRPLPEMRLWPESEIDWANAVTTQSSHLWKDWFQTLETCGIGLSTTARSDDGKPGRQLVLKNFVTKRIFHRGIGSSKDDNRALLAAITNEIRVLCRDGVRSSNHVVSLIAIAWDPHPTVNDRFWPCLVLEGAPHGRVDEYLQSNQGTNYATKLGMLMGVISAMAWLYEFGVVHRDIKPANILVFDLPPKEWLKSSFAALGVAPIRIKLCDFGCATILDDYKDDHEFTCRVGTPGWMAPEVSMGLPLKPNMLLAADIFSLGLVVASLFLNGKSPRPAIPTMVDTHGDSRADFYGQSNIEDLLDEIRSTQNYESEQMDTIGRLLALAVQPQPEDRVSLAELYKHLEGHMNAMALEVLQDLMNIDPVRGPLMYQDIMEHLCHFPAISDTPLYLRNPRPYLGKSFEDTPYLGLPNVAYESDFRWIYLPRGTQREVWHDLRVRAESTGRDAGLCAFLAASLTINGAEQTPEGADFQPYLENAVRLGEPKALYDAISIFDALKGYVPDNVQGKIFDYFREPSFRARALVNAKCGHYKGFKVDRDLLVGWKTFIHERRHEFEEFLLSEDYCRITSTIPAIALECLRAGNGWLRVSAEDTVWNSQQISHNPFAQGQNLDVYDRSFFVAEVLELECLDEPDEEGFTLLQRAVFHGNHTIAELLLDTLGADVEAFGFTPQWTPLWLACWLGHYEIAVLLVAHGADLGCRDTLHRCGPLELLGQFHAKEQVEGIGYSALAHGVMIQNGVDGRHKNTLSFCSMLGDFSSGAAVHFLLANGAVADTEALVTRIIRLDFDTLKDPQFEVSWKHGVEIAAVKLLTRRTRFEHILLSGSRYRDKLTPTLRLLTEPVMARELGILELSAILATVVHNRREDVLQALLSIHPYASLDFAQRCINGTEQVLLLGRAINIGHPGSVRVLIEHGADVLAVIEESEHTFKGANMVEYMAIIIPSMIPLAMKQLESRGDVNMKAVPSKLGIPGPDLSTDQTVFSLLLESGGWFGEIEIAERLRARLNLEHDADLSDSDGCRKITPTARMMFRLIRTGSATELLIGLQYLLSLQPKPRFTWGDGRTLLHIGVIDPANMPPEEKFTLLRLLVNTYPEETMAALLQGTVFHFAAKWANVEALEFLRDQIETNPVAQTLTEEEKTEMRCFNRVHYSQDHALTPLDEAMTSIDDSFLRPWDKDFPKSSRMMLIESLRQDGPWGRPWDLGLFDSTLLVERPLQCYKFLRANGALHFLELEGYIIRGYILPADVLSHDEFISILRKVAVEQSLGGCLASGEENPSYVPTIVSQAAPLSSSGKLAEAQEHALNALNTKIAMSKMPKPVPETSRKRCSWFRVCEIVWRHSNFYIRGYVLGAGLHGSSIKAELDSWVQYRLDDRILMWLMSGEQLYGKIAPPFARLNYARIRPNARSHPEHEKTSGTVEWTRGGKVWSEEKVQELAKGVMTQIEQSLGPFTSSADITDELKEVVPNHFKPEYDEYYEPGTSQKGKERDIPNQTPEGAFLTYEKINPEIFPFWPKVLAERGFEFQEDFPKPGNFSIWPHGVSQYAWPALMKEIEYQSCVEVWKANGDCGPEGPFVTVNGLGPEVLPLYTSLLADRKIKFHDNGGGTVKVWPPIPPDEWPAFLEGLYDESCKSLARSSAESVEKSSPGADVENMTDKEKEELWTQAIRMMQNLGPKEPNVDHSS